MVYYLCSLNSSLKIYESTKNWIRLFSSSFQAFLMLCTCSTSRLRDFSELTLQCLQSIESTPPEAKKPRRTFAEELLIFGTPPSLGAPFVKQNQPQSIPMPRNRNAKNLLRWLQTLTLSPMVRQRIQVTRARTVDHEKKGTASKTRL